MSFAGIIRALMNGLGLQSAFETLFGKKTVKYMLMGKAISKAIRGNFLAESALNIYFMSQLLT